MNSALSVPVLLVDDLLHLPASTPLMSEEAEAFRRSLGRRQRDGLVVVHGRSGDAASFENVKLTVLISDVDQDHDHGASLIVGATYLRQISRYHGTILAVAFSRTGSRATPPRLVPDHGIPGLHLAPMGSTPDQVFQLIRDHLRL